MCVCACLCVTKSRNFLTNIFSFPNLIEVTHSLTYFAIDPNAKIWLKNAFFCLTLPFCRSRISFICIFVRRMQIITLADNNNDKYPWVNHYLKVDNSIQIFCIPLWYYWRPTNFNHKVNKNNHFNNRLIYYVGFLLASFVCNSQLNYLSTQPNRGRTFQCLTHSIC